MVFGRRPERFAEWVSTAWARRFSWDDMDPEEERWGCATRPTRWAIRSVLPGHLRGDGAPASRDADAARSRTRSRGWARCARGARPSCWSPKAGRCSGQINASRARCRRCPPRTARPRRRRRRASTWGREGSCSAAPIRGTLRWRKCPPATRHASSLAAGQRERLSTVARSRQPRERDVLPDRPARPCRVRHADRREVATAPRGGVVDDMPGCAAASTRCSNLASATDGFMGEATTSTPA